MKHARGAVALAAGAVCLGACGEHAPDDDASDALQLGSVGASLARVGDVVVVVDPDADRLSFVDPTSLDVRDSLAVGDEPRTVLPLDGERVLVALHSGAELVLVDVGARSVVSRQPGCAGAFGLALTPAGDAVLASCEWDGTVVRWREGAGALEVVGAGFVRPRPVAASDGEVLVGEYTRGTVVVISDQGSHTIDLVPRRAAYRPALTHMTANLVAAFAVTARRLAVAYELVNHRGEQTVEPVDADYGSLTQGNPKINPALGSLVRRGGAWELEDAAVTYAVYDGGERAVSNPVALATYDATRVLVAHASTSDVALVRLGVGSPDGRVEQVWRGAAGPFGVLRDGDALLVDAFLDGATSRFSASGAGLTRVRPGSSPLAPGVLAGRKLFYDATNGHVTPARVVSCATCHPEGGDDGLTWFIGTPRIPDKVRRTPHLANATSATAPFHWDGQLPGVAELVQSTVTDLMAGDGLLVDGTLVGAYLDEGVVVPQRPVSDAALVARGASLFAGAAGCSVCHAGATFTDGARHQVLDAPALVDPATLAEVDTPGLRALFLRAPYFHDGSSPTLEHVLGRGDASRHGAAAALSGADRDALVAYLASL